MWQRVCVFVVSGSCANLNWVALSESEIQEVLTNCPVTCGVAEPMDDPEFVINTAFGPASCAALATYYLPVVGGSCANLVYNGWLSPSAVQQVTTACPVTCGVVECP